MAKVKKIKKEMVKKVAKKAAAKVDTRRRQAPARKTVPTSHAKPVAKVPVKAPAVETRPELLKHPEVRRIEPRTPEARRLELRKMPDKPVDFSTNDFVVYPTHGVGKITGIEEREIGGTKHKLFVISFEKDKMTLRVPIGKATATGMRRLSTPKEMASALQTLKGRSRVKRTMWSRRAQEYEAKINSGDPVAIAEVVRDLHRNVGQPEQSYSERQLYEAALARLARELAAVETIDEEAATEKLEQVLRAA